MKRIFSVLLLAVLLTAMSITVSAHPGKTDETGGHYDHETGEYHYHHGYDAHSHYDMDGDGVVDCPYDFDDQTDHSNHGGAGINSSHTWDYSSSTQKEDAVETIVKEIPFTPDWVYFVFAAAAVVIIILAARLYTVCGERDDAEIRHRQKVNSIENEHQDNVSKIKQSADKAIIELRTRNQKLLIEKAEKESEHRTALLANEARHSMEVKLGLHLLHKDLISLLGDNYLCRLSGAPNGHFLNGDGLPMSKPSRAYPWGKEYTFYKGKKVYHSFGCQHALPQNAVNAYLVRDEIPCRICQPELPDMEWVDKYNAHAEFIGKYLKTKEDTSKE